MTTTPDTWTTRSLLAWMNERFQRQGIESPRLCAELLMAHVIGCDRLRLYMDADRPATPIERSTLRELVGRAIEHEPVQYLVGEAWFFSLPFSVDRRVLIPRPSTETLVEFVLQHARAESGFDHPSVADICTGSGCIAISIAKNLTKSRVAAVDVSPDALQVARQNAQRHHVSDRIDFLQGDLLAPLEEHPLGSQLHYLLANPPYIPDHEWTTAGLVGQNVKGFEPDLALRGGPDGLRYVRPLIEKAPSLLRKGGVLAIEVAASTSDDVLRLAAEHELLGDVRMLKDSDRLPRVLIARRT